MFEICFLDFRSKTSNFLDFKSAFLTLKSNLLILILKLKLIESNIQITLILVEKI